MSDPLSITVGVASLVGTAINVLHTLQTYYSKYQVQNLAAISVKAQCDCIHLALRHIQTAMLSNQGMATRFAQDDSLSGQQLGSVLGACQITFTILVERLSKMNRSLGNESGALSRRDRLERLWNESNITELSQNISRLSEGLNLLLTALNTRSLFEIQQILTSPRASIIFEQVADDAGSAYASNCSISYVSGTNWNVDSRPDSSSTIDPKDFAFDQELLMSRAYQKVQNSRGTLGRAPPSSILPVQNGPNTSIRTPVSRQPASHRVVDQVHSAAALTKGNATDIGSKYKNFSEPTLLNSHSIRPRHAPQIEREIYLGTYPQKPKVPKTPGTNLTNRAISEESIGRRDTDKINQTDQQNLVNISIRGKPPKLIEPKLDNQKVVSDSNLKLDKSSKEVTLRDFIPEDLKMPWVLNSTNTLEKLPTFSNPPGYRHVLYATSTEVNIVGMGMTNIPESAIVAVHVTIESLLLCQNRISQLPLSISACQSLEYLNLTENYLTKFPLEICSIKTLRTLALAVNAVTEIPIEFQNLTNLEFFNIASNRLIILPNLLTKMGNLKTILAHNNDYVSPALQRWQNKNRYVYSSTDQERGTTKLKKILTDIFLSSSADPLLDAEDLKAGNSNIGPERGKHPISEIGQSTISRAGKRSKWPEFGRTNSSDIRARARWAGANSSEMDGFTSDSEDS